MESEIHACHGQADAPVHAEQQQSTAAEVSMLLPGARINVHNSRQVTTHLRRCICDISLCCITALANPACVWLGLLRRCCLLTDWDVYRGSFTSGIFQKRRHSCSCILCLL